MKRAQVTWLPVAHEELDLPEAEFSLLLSNAMNPQSLGLGFVISSAF
jgi:hypothetical protein